MQMRFCWALGGMLALGSCEDADGAGSGSTSSGTTSGTDDSAGNAAGDDGAATSGGSGGGEGGGECIPWVQDCPDEDDKCMPWSLDDDQLPDTYKCCPIAETTVPAGEQCEIFDYNGSCEDNCEKGAFCVLDRPEDLQGYCHVFCDAASPQCAPDETCKSFFELLEPVPNVPVCMHQCDPLLQDCERPGWSCLPDYLGAAGMSGFICNPPPPYVPSGVQQPCLLGNDCDIGLVCISGDRVPGCDGTNCCTTYCSNSEAMSGNDPCTMLHVDAVCVDWMSPDPQWSDVGVCALPA